MKSEVKDEYTRLINSEIKKSERKLKSKNSKSISDLSKLFNSFSNEVTRLNKSIPAIGNKFIETYNLTEEDIVEIKKMNAELMEKFIAKSNIPGVNKDFKIDI